MELIARSSSWSVGLFRLTSISSVLRRWLVSGSSWSLNQSITPARPIAAIMSGIDRRARFTPLALSAVISLSAASALKAKSTATSTAMGSVSASTWGSDSMKTSAITEPGSPLPARSSMRRATVLIMSSPVRTPSAKRNGPVAAFRR